MWDMCSAPSKGEVKPHKVHARNTPPYQLAKIFEWNSSWADFIEINLRSSSFVQLRVEFDRINDITTFKMKYTLSIYLLWFGWSTYSPLNKRWLRYHVSISRIAIESNGYLE